MIYDKKQKYVWGFIPAGHIYDGIYCRMVKTVDIQKALKLFYETPVHDLGNTFWQFYSDTDMLGKNLKLCK